MKSTLILLILIFLQACGSGERTEVDITDSAILNGLRNKAKVACLKGKKSLIEDMQNKASDVFSKIKEGDTWTLTYKTQGSGSTTTNHIIDILVHRIDDPGTDNVSIIYYVRNETPPEEGEGENVTRYRYTLRNQRDHIHMYFADACSGDNPVTNASAVTFTIDESSTTQSYNLKADQISFLSRYMSFKSEIRTGDTTDKKGPVSSTTTITGPTKTATITFVTAPSINYIFNELIFDSTTLLPSIDGLNVKKSLGLQGKEGSLSLDSNP